MSEDHKARTTQEQIGDPTGFGLSGPPEFDTDQVIDWTCPCCGEDGYHKPRLRDSFVGCTNRDCAVNYFTCFRGEPNADE